MNNEENLIFESLQNDIAQIGSTLQEISSHVINSGISDYPVFIASQSLVDLGKLIFKEEEVQLNWFFYASILEDFVKKGIVKEEKLWEFGKTIGDPMETACVFALFEGDAKFVFIPYKTGNNE